MMDHNSLLQEDLRQMLELLGMGTHARPQSPHAVFQDALTVLRQRLDTADNWQPIETAPRDGTAILLGMEFCGKFYRYIGRWDEEAQRWAQGDGGRQFFAHPLQMGLRHWAALPEPPKGEAA